MKNQDQQTRNGILAAATSIFANHGYTGSFVQDIVNKAKITKPTLYYHFGNKAGLYLAVVNSAHDIRFELMQRAAGGNDTLAKQLEDILSVLFRFARQHRDLMRLCFMTAFASPGEIPGQDEYFKKGRRNFEFLHTLIKQGVTSGELSSKHKTEDLTTAIFGQILFYGITQAVTTKHVWKRRGARQIVELFLQGASPKRRNG